MSWFRSINYYPSLMFLRRDIARKRERERRERKENEREMECQKKYEYATKHGFNNIGQ